MSLKHCYLLVEGQQDVLFVGRLLQTLGVPDIQNFDVIDSRWCVFQNTGRLVEHRGRLAVGQQGLNIHELFNGVCFQNETHSIVVRKVSGRGRLFRNDLQSTNALLDGGLNALHAVGLLPDADDNPINVRRACEDQLRAVNLEVPLSDCNTSQASPHTGIYPLPSPTETGAVEELMLDCAQHVYADLLVGARHFIDAIDLQSSAFTSQDTAEIRKPRGKSKATVGCIASFLKPGSTVQVSILQDRWISPGSIQQPRIVALSQFLKDLCGL